MAFAGAVGMVAWMPDSALSGLSIPEIAKRLYIPQETAELRMHL